MARHWICSFAGPLGREVRRPEVTGWEYGAFGQPVVPGDILDAIIATKLRIQAQYAAQMTNAIGVLYSEGEKP